MARTTLDFDVDVNIWPIVDSWEKTFQGQLKESSANRRLYHRGRGLMANLIMCEISQTGRRVHIEGWTALPPFSPFRFLGKTAEQDLSGGLSGGIPRTVGRNALNDLLRRLGQEEIS